MRIAVLVKQIPNFEEMELGPDGRLRRDGIDLEMNPYCRRAVAKAVELAAGRDRSQVVVFTLGPAAADDTLREAIAWGLDRGVDIRGVHVTDVAFAGSDTLATAKALAAALTCDGPFDLVLTGRNSVDADTGQVGPELAELLDLPFLTGVRYLNVSSDHVVDARCEHDDGWLQAEVTLPAVLSCAERLCEPTKVDPAGRAAVASDRVRRLRAADLGAGAWGADASPTWVGPVKVMAVSRARMVHPDRSLADQVRAAVRVLHERGSLRPDTFDGHTDSVPRRRTLSPEPAVAVVVEPDRAHAARELLGVAARLAAEIDRSVVAITVSEPEPEPDLLGAWGADQVVHLEGGNVEEDVARVVTEWADAHRPWAIIAGSTAWGREVASRAAARLEAGLTGDAVDLEVSDGRLIAWKPAFGGQLVAAIGATSAIQMATVRAGMISAPAPRSSEPSPAVARIAMTARGRIRVLARTRDDDLDVLAEAAVVIGVGRGVRPDEYDALEPLRILVGAELGATRKVTDEGWLPRSRQVGITGRSIAPRLFVSIGASGKFNHTVGLRAARTVLAINRDADAPIFQSADVGIVADWRDAVPLVVTELGR